MSVTVVVPTRGVGAHLESSVDNAIRAAAATGPDAEVLVVANGPTGAPALAGMRSPLLRVICLEEANVSRARNVGIDEARNDTIIFGDDGGACPDSWCVELAAALDDPAYPLVTAPVRVPVLGPVTAYLNHQRVFDAPPLDAERAKTVTGACGLRRDRLPATLRYDEANLNRVGEDVAFGHAARAAGLSIRWLGTIAPGLHLLPDRLSEITNRMMGYGRGAALVWRRNGGGVPSPAEVMGLYRYLSSPGYRAHRRFSEVADAGLRAAFAVYDYLYDLSFLVGYLATANEEELCLALDRDGLAAAWQRIADVAAAEVGADALDRVTDGGAASGVNADRGEPDGPAVDFARVDGGTPAGETLLAEVRKALARHASPRSPRGSEAPAESGDATGVTGSAGARASDHDAVRQWAASPELARLLDMWRRLRADGGPITADQLDGEARAVGYPFRDACAAIERAAMRRARLADGAAAGVVGASRSF